MRAALDGKDGLPGWVGADSSVVLAIARGEEPRHGPRGIWLRRLFGLLGASPAGRLALRAVALLSALSSWRRCRRGERAPHAAVVVVGMGAGAEAGLVREVQETAGGAVAHVDQRDPSTLGKVVCPPLGHALRTAWRAAGGGGRAIRGAGCAEARDHRSLWMASVARRVGAYGFFRAWAEALPSSVERLVFLAMDVAAFAAGDARGGSRLPVLEHRQHGLIRWSLAVAPFDHVIAMSAPEAGRFREGGNTVVLLPREASSSPPEGVSGKALLLASMYDVPGVFLREDNAPELEGLLSWAGTMGLAPVVRPHPREEGGFWSSRFPSVERDEGASTFADVLARRHPRLVASWASTALLDALAAGRLPVLLPAGAAPILEDMVLPLEEVCLVWPRDRLLFEECLRDPDAYARELRSRWTMAFTGGGTPRRAPGK